MNFINFKKNNYPEKHLLGWADYNSIREQYFEFPELYRRGTVFIDAGCCNRESSYRFAKWCDGAYSSIIAFEPDPNNHVKCRKIAQDISLPDFQLINAGLSSQEGTAVFDAQSSGSSHVIFAGSTAEFIANMPETSNKISNPTVTIDDTVGERTVGFIKMDIEGGELDALQGAKKNNRSG